MDIQLVQIDVLGRPVRNLGPMEDIAVQACNATACLYQTTGFVSPWVGYLAIYENQFVGACAFKSPPRDGTIEIGYITFPDFEGKGVATSMVRRLLEIVRSDMPQLSVTVQTASEKNASNTILKKYGFQFAGTIDDAEEGTLWEWKLAGSDRAE